MAYLLVSQVGLQATGYKLCCSAIAKGKGKKHQRDLLVELGEELHKYVSDHDYSGKHLFCRVPGLNFLSHQLPPEYASKEGNKLSGLAEILRSADRGEIFDRHSANLASMFKEISDDVDQELWDVNVNGGLPRVRLLSNPRKKVSLVIN